MAVNIKGKQGESPKGKNGDNGILFTPTISNGELSWSNNGGLPNPPNSAVNTKTQIEELIHKHDTYLSAHYHILQLISNKWPELPLYDKKYTVVKIVTVTKAQTIYISEVTPSNSIIDWGDGTVEKVSSMPGYHISHTYLRDAEYIIKIEGATHIKFGNVIPIIEAIQCGNSLTDCKDMFQGVTSLKLLRNTFTIPNKVTDCWDMFWECTGLQSLPKTFIIPPWVTVVRGFFSGCSNLNANINDIINNLFNQDVDVRLCFENCSKLTGDVNIVKQYLWGDTSKIWTLSHGCFTGCTGLTNFDQIPDDWK